MLQQMQMNPQNLSTLSPPVTCFHYYSTPSHKNTKILMEYPFKIQQKNVTHPISATVSTNTVSFVPLFCCNPWSALWRHNFNDYTCYAFQKFWYKSLTQ